MSKTEDRLERAAAPQTDPAGNGQVGTDAAGDRSGILDGHGLPLAAYVPMGANSRYERPKATINPDRSLSWIKRAAPIVMAHKKQWFAAVLFAFAGLMVQVWIPLLLQNGITATIAHDTGKSFLRIFTPTT